MSLFKDGFPIIKVLKQNQTRKVDRDKGILNFFLDWNILMTSQKCRTGPFDFEFFIVFGSGLGLDEGRFAWTWARQYTYKIEQKFKKFNMLLTVRVICK